MLNEEDEHIGDALETVFPMWTEDAYMVWNGIHIPIGYKYTLSFLIQDAVMMLERVSQEASGKLEIRWPSNDFAATWYLTWDEGGLGVRAEWDSVVGETAALLNSRPTVALEKRVFISEWKQVLEVALNALTQAGYRDNQLRDLAKLKSMCESIAERGVLYASENRLEIAECANAR